MKHEPECQGPYLADDCVDCAVARAAYKRGREDAAKAVRQLHSDPFVITHELDPDAQRYCRACSIWHDCEEWGQTTGKSALVKVEWPCPTLRALDGEQA